MKKQHIAFIGCGNMGSSLMGGLLADGYDPAMLSGCEPDAARREKVVEHYGIEVYADALSAVNGADIVVLAVKPQQMAAVCREIAPALMQDCLVISIAAGIELASLERWLGRAQPIVRVMPNTPALIGAGASGLVANRHTRIEQKNAAEAILRSVGIALWLEDEAMMNIVTAVSGSGPAYFFLIMEIMQKAATGLGLAADDARLLTLQTALGAARMALESESETGQLRRQVTSPGGTTEQALKVLMDAGLDEIVTAAIRAACERSAELARVYGNEQD